VTDVVPIPQVVANDPAALASFLTEQGVEYTLALVEAGYLAIESIQDPKIKRVASEQYQRQAAEATQATQEELEAQAEREANPVDEDGEPVTDDSA